MFWIKFIGICFVDRRDPIWSRNVIIGKNPEAILLATEKSEIFRRFLHERETGGRCSQVRPMHDVAANFKKLFAYIDNSETCKKYSIIVLKNNFLREIWRSAHKKIMWREKTHTYTALVSENVKFYEKIHALNAFKCP